MLLLCMLDRGIWVGIEMVDDVASWFAIETVDDLATCATEAKGVDATPGEEEFTTE
jgi:hypothetical protein